MGEFSLLGSRFYTSTLTVFPKFMSTVSNYSVMIRGAPPMILAATFTFLFYSSVNLCRSWSLCFESMDCPESLRCNFMAGAATKVLRFLELKRDLIWILFWSLWVTNLSSYFFFSNWNRFIIFSCISLSSQQTSRRSLSLKTYST